MKKKLTELVDELLAHNISKKYMVDSIIDLIENKEPENAVFAKEHLNRLFVGEFGTARIVGYHKYDEIGILCHVSSGWNKNSISEEDIALADISGCENFWYYEVDSIKNKL